MRTIVVGLLLCVSPVCAQAPAAPTPKEQYEALLKEFEASVAAWEKRGDDAEPWPAMSFVPRFVKLAEANLGDPIATDALLWVVNKGTNIQVASQGFYPHYRRALELLTRSDHLDDKRFGRACTQGLQYASAPAETFLRVLIGRSGDREVRGRACLALAKILSNKVTIAGLPQFDPNVRAASNKDVNSSLDPEYVKYFRDVDLKASKAEAEGLFERSIKEYGDIVYRRARKTSERDVTIADAARAALHTLRDLAIGSAAPDTVAEDLDGKLMKLGEQRGKIVVLMFWATWCGPCMDLVPHERNLVERLKGKPFVLLGINGDEDREQAKRAVNRERITWRSWWNGGPTGPITDQYNVEGWPTVYVLDAKGVIRYKQVVEESLDESVDALLKTMENATPPGS